MYNPKYTFNGYSEYSVFNHISFRRKKDNRPQKVVPQVNVGIPETYNQENNTMAPFVSTDNSFNDIVTLIKNESQQSLNLIMGNSNNNTDYAIFAFAGPEQIPVDNSYITVPKKGKAKTLLFDLPTFRRTFN